MELKQGYKLTEIGVIPENWSLRPHNEIATIIDSLHQTPSFSSTGYAMVRVTDIKPGNLDLSKALRVNSKVYSEFIQNHKPTKGNIVLSRVGSYGVSSFVETSEPFCMGQNTVVIEPKIENRFLYFILNSNIIQNQIEFESYGTGYKSLSLKNIKDLKIPIPPLPEQKNIAQVLSDTDILIQAIELKLSKKRAIKQGVMQQLFTPKKDWELIKLGDIGKTFGGLSGKSKSDFSNGSSIYIPFMNVMSNPIIDTDYVGYVFIKPNEIQNKAIKGDLFFNGSSETPEEVGLCSVLLESLPNLYLNSFCFGFRLFNQKEFNGLYLSYFFRSDEGRKLFYSLAQGATRYNLSKANFLKLQFKIPNPLEQAEFATILSDIDAEIQQLKQKLLKYKLIKQGLMQNLLTGKIRLL